MVKRPKDPLEFFRRTSGEQDLGPVGPGSELESTPRMLVLRRSQAVVAMAAAAVALLAAFLLGRGLGGGEAEDAPLGNVGVWVIRVVSYEDNERGRRYAKTVMSQLERLRLGDEVNLRRIGSTNKLAVTVGSWLQHPQGEAGADKLLGRVKSIQGRDSNERPFASADYWRIVR